MEYRKYRKLVKKTFWINLVGTCFNPYLIMLRHCTERLLIIHEPKETFQSEKDSYILHMKNCENNSLNTIKYIL